MTSPEISLLHNLTAFDSQYAATDMIRTLIERLGWAVSDSAIGRNTHTLSTSLYLSRTICNSIHSLITASFAEDNWDSFDKWRILVEPLEDVLLKLSAVAGEVYVETIDTAHTIEQWIAAGDTWASTRTSVTDGLKLLFEDKRFEDIVTGDKDATVLRNHDDDAFLDSLSRGLGEEGRKKGQRAKYRTQPWTKLVDIERQVEAIQSKLKIARERDDEMLGYAIRFALIANGMIEVTVKTDNEDVKKHLGSTKVVTAAISISKNIYDLISSQSITDKNRSDFREQWALFLELLKQVVAPPSTISVVELRKLPANIRAPYYLQSIALVTACRALVGHQGSAEHEVDIETARSAVNAAVAALKSASEIVFSGATSIKALRNDDVDKAYAAAWAEVEKSFLAYSLKFESDVKTKAEQTDSARLTAWEQIMAKAERQEPGQTVHVSVDVKDNSSTPHFAMTKTYDVPVNAKLDLVLWRVCNEADAQGQRNRIRAKDSFVQFPSRNVLRLSDNVPAGTKEKPAKLELRLDDAHAAH